jgi:hypothetical protein
VTALAQRFRAEVAGRRPFGIVSAPSPGASSQVVRGRDKVSRPRTPDGHRSTDTKAGLYREAPRRQPSCCL